MDGQGCHHLPPTTAMPWGGTHFLASTESNITSALGTWISLEAFRRNPPQDWSCTSTGDKTHKTESDKQERELKLI